MGRDDTDRTLPIRVVIQVDRANVQSFGQDQCVLVGTGSNDEPARRAAAEQQTPPGKTSMNEWLDEICARRHISGLDDRILSSRKKLIKGSRNLKPVLRARPKQAFASAIRTSRSRRGFRSDWGVR